MAAANDPDEGATLNVRIRRALRDEVDRAAHEWAMNRSEWVIKVIEDALRRTPRGRSTTVLNVQRSRTYVAGRTPPQLCNHPLSVRSDPDERGDSRCMSCDSIIRRLP